jgi:hypothetical protein
MQVVHTLQRIPRPDYICMYPILFGLGALLNHKDICNKDRGLAGQYPTIANNGMMSRAYASYDFRGRGAFERNYSVDLGDCIYSSDSSRDLSIYCIIFHFK